MRFIKNMRFSRDGGRKHQKTILALCAVSILFFGLARVFPPKSASPLEREMLQAAKIMAGAVKDLKECRRSIALSVDCQNDPNETGLIGPNHSSITTSLGSLEAKRTTTNPNFAGLVVLLMREAGVCRGDTVAVGASGSFPALIVAVLAAAKAMEVRPLLFCSLGASQWGANHPRFNWLCMMECLLKKRVFEPQTVGLSLGGDRDTGKDMEHEGRTLLIADIKQSGIPFLLEPYLRRNVLMRLRLYERASGGQKIKAFINIGGSWANIGTDARILKVKPGLVWLKDLPPEENRGVIHEMAARDIPVIHLLYIRGLVRRYGLPWDPVPLPSIGKGRIYETAREVQPVFLLLAVLYLAAVFFVVYKIK